MSDDTPVVEERELTKEEQEALASAFAEGCEFGYNQYAEDLVRALRRLAGKCKVDDTAEFLGILAQAIEDDELIEEQDTEDPPQDVSDLVPNLDIN